MNSKKNKDFIQFGLLEWDKLKNTVTMCPLLAETLAFSNFDTTQSLAAYRKLIHPEDLETIEIIKKKIKEKEEAYIVTESRRLCRDGTWRWFNFRGKILETDKNGDIVRGFGTCTDITSFKEHEEEFYQMKMLLTEIKHIKKCYKNYKRACHTADSLAESIYTEAFVCSEILSSLEKITNSQKSLFIFYYTRHFNKKKFNYDVLFDHNRNSIDELLLSAEKLNFIKTLQVAKEHIIQNGNGTSFLGIYLDLPFEQQSMIILERSAPFENVLLDFIEPFISIAKRSISFKSLGVNHNELDNITTFFIEQVPAPVAMFDTNMCYKFASTEWCKSFKLGDPLELIGKSHYDVHPLQPKEWRNKHLRGLTGEILSCKAEKIANLIKEPCWVEWSIHPWYTMNKKIGGVFIYANIITDRIESEKSIQTAVNNLIRSNQSLDRFAHVCSHDLKEPLRSISNFIQLLFSHNLDKFDEESLIYMRHTLKGIDRMHNLIKDILSYSEAAEHEKREKNPININEIIHEIKESFDYRLTEIGGHLSVEPLPTILGAPTQINQLFTNLIGNAIKFHSERPLTINIFAVDRGPWWEFHVSDNGIGIAPEYHKSIFTMFSRLHSKNQYEGSGIGLATCQKIVNDHNGEIYVQSTPEGGSDFVFTVPAVPS
ncbi:MAG: ATP-binding protein [Pseudomonadota bacterium]